MSIYDMAITDSQRRRNWDLAMQDVTAQREQRMSQVQMARDAAAAERAGVPAAVPVQDPAWAQTSAELMRETDAIVAISEQQAVQRRIAMLREMSGIPLRANVDPLPGSAMLDEPVVTSTVPVFSTTSIRPLQLEEAPEVPPPIEERFQPWSPAVLVGLRRVFHEQHDRLERQQEDILWLRQQVENLNANMDHQAQRASQYRARVESLEQEAGLQHHKIISLRAEVAALRQAQPVSSPLIYTPYGSSPYTLSSHTSPPATLEELAQRMAQQGRAPADPPVPPTEFFGYAILDSQAILRANFD